MMFNKLTYLRCEPVAVGFIRPENNGRHKCRPYNFEIPYKNIVSLFSILVFLIFAPLLSATDVVSSGQLIKNSAEYDGKSVTYRGEVIGEVMERGKYGWINVTDGEDTIGIWCKKEDLNKIKFAGSYRIKGDKVEITGVFNRSCSRHQGGLDLHAEKLEVIEPGKEITLPLDFKKVKLIVIFAFSALGLIFLSSLRKSSLKKPQEPTPPSSV